MTNTQESKMTFKPFREWYSIQKSSKNPKKMHKPKKELQEETGLSPSMANKIWNDDNVTLATAAILCRTYKLKVEQVLLHEYEDDATGQSYE